MNISSQYLEVIPLITTFGSAIISTFYDVGKKWQDFIIGLLGILLVFFAYIFFTEEFSSSLAVHSFFDIRYNKFSIYVALLFCASLFTGLFPIRKSVSLSPHYLFYVAGGLGIILSNNLPTFFLFWCFQRALPVFGFFKDAKRDDSVVGATYLFQHLLTSLCFIGLMIMAHQKDLLITPMTEMPASFFTWPVLLLSFIIVYEAHGLFPFHSWVHDMIENVPWYEFSAVFLSRAGVLLFVQLILPNLKYDPDLFKILLLSLAILSSIYWSFRGVLESNLSRCTNYFYIAQASLLLTGLQADLTAAKGSYLHMMVISISGTSLFSIVSYIQHYFSLKRSSRHYGMAQYFPVLATLFCLFGFCMIGVPMGGSFVVEDLVITGLLHYKPYLGLGHIFATCLNGILFFLIFSKLFLGQTPYQEPVVNKDMPLSQMYPYLLALILIVLLGLVPSLFLERITW